MQQTCAAVPFGCFERPGHVPMMCPAARGCFAICQALFPCGALVSAFATTHV
jgi:hypothetical protein